MACNPSSSKQMRGNQKQSSAKNNQNICGAATPRQRGYQAHSDSAKQMVCLHHHSRTHILHAQTHTRIHISGPWPGVSWCRSTPLAGKMKGVWKVLMKSDRISVVRSSCYVPAKSTCFAMFLEHMQNQDNSIFFSHVPFVLYPLPKVTLYQAPAWRTRSDLLCLTLVTSVMLSYIYKQKYVFI